MSEPLEYDGSFWDDVPSADVDRLCEVFERAWMDGEQPPIEDYLKEVQESERGVLFRELLLLEVYWRREFGQAVTEPEYAARFPDYTDMIAPILSADGATEQRQQRRDRLLPRKRLLIRLNCPHCHNPIQIVDDGSTEGLVCPSCGSTFQVESDATVSWSPENLPQLGKFQLIERVGRGAFGTVYRARDTELDRIVAIKVPRSGTFFSKDEEDRFVREARSVARLHHPGLVPVHEVARSKDFPYIVSEFVEGVTLSETLTARRFSFQESAQMIALLADALDHCHRNGVVHRDVKPSNVMLERVTGALADSFCHTDLATIDGNSASSNHTQVNDSTASRNLTTLEFQPRLMDFGLARRDEGEITVTVEGHVLGTPAYMSPEQARGIAHRADGRSDIYSLGVMLYELLVGELPFRGTTRMLLQQVLYDEPRPLRTINDRIPRDLETITLKAMSKELARRYPSASELATDLRRWLSGEPITARPVSRVERLWRWCSRNRLVASLIAAIVLVLFGGTAISMWFAIDADNLAHRETVAHRYAEQAREKADRERKNVLAALKQIRAEGALVEHERDEAQHLVGLLMRITPSEIDRFCKENVVRVALLFFLSPKKMTFSGNTIETPCAVRLREELQAIPGVQVVAPSVVAAAWQHPTYVEVARAAPRRKAPPPGSRRSEVSSPVPVSPGREKLHEPPQIVSSRSNRKPTSTPVGETFRKERESIRPGQAPRKLNNISVRIKGLYPGKIENLARSVRADLILWGTVDRTKETGTIYLCAYRASGERVASSAPLLVDDLDKPHKRLSDIVFQTMPGGLKGVKPASVLIYGSKQTGDFESIIRRVGKGYLAKKDAFELLVNGEKILSDARHEHDRQRQRELAQRAKVVLKDCVARADATPLVYLLLSDCADILGDSTEMRRQLTLAQQAVRETTDPVIRLEVEADYAMRVSHKTDEAIVMYEKLLQMAPNAQTARRAHFVLARLYLSPVEPLKDDIAMFRKIHSARRHILALLANWPESPEANEYQQCVVLTAQSGVGTSPGSPIAEPLIPDALGALENRRPIGQLITIAGR